MIDTEEEVEFSSMFVTDYIEEIEKNFNNIPDKRKKSDYINWKFNLNKMIIECNKLSGTKIYNIIK